jgi:protein ImuA
MNLAALRQQIRALQQGGKAHGVLPFEVAEIDAGLPGGGLALGALHDIGGTGPAAEDGAVAAAFIAGILARLQPQRPVLWCLEHADLYPWGLALSGLSPARLILAQAVSDRDILWAIEEGLRCQVLAAVVGETQTLPVLASRRLQLAAETSGVTAFVLHRHAALAPTSAAATRWRVSALPGSARPGEPGVGQPRWRLELLRCRGGVPASWDVEASDATGHVSLSAALADRTLPQPQRALG